MFYSYLTESIKSWDNLSGQLSTWFENELGPIKLYVDMLYKSRVNLPNPSRFYIYGYGNVEELECIWKMWWSNGKLAWRSEVNMNIRSYALLPFSKWMGTFHVKSSLGKK